jgi:hypothetical protein
MFGLKTDMKEIIKMKILFERIEWSLGMTLMSLVSAVCMFMIVMLSYNIVDDYGRENRLLRAIASDQALILEGKRINFTSPHELELNRQKYNKLLGDMYE